MTDTIRPGAMLVEDGIPTPESLVVDTKSYSSGWSSITNSSSAHLGREIENAGWTFFYMAGEIRTRRFGFTDESRTDRAVAHIMAAVKLQNCNCLEITEVTRRSFFGLSYTSLVAHARHIQRSRVFHGRSVMVPNAHSVACKHVFTGEPVQASENAGGSGACVDAQITASAS
ncbi:MAG: hypothetical protein ACJ74Z_00035 [Bryobacteraceae bacterium]